jgi:hypothetical protein
VTEKAKYPFDGHTPQDVLKRMYEIIWKKGYKII